MNMKRIVFIAVGILVMLGIIAWMLYSIAHVDEINQQRREKNRGEALASRMITTTATTSVWDALRQTETETNAPAVPGESAVIPEESDIAPEESLPEEENQEQEDVLSEETAPIPQTVTEVLQ